MPFNRTAYGIEILFHPSEDLLYGLLIAPLMELKYKRRDGYPCWNTPFNRTAYGIEIPNSRKLNPVVGAFNRTAYGIEMKSGVP